MAVDGKVPFEVGGKQYIWHFSVGAICALEDRLDRGLLDIAGELQSWLPPTKLIDGKQVVQPETAEQARARNGRVRMGFARDVFWSGLQDHQPEMTLRDAGDLIGQLGGLIPAIGIIIKGLSDAMPSPSEENPSRPRKASRKKAAG